MVLKIELFCPKQLKIGQTDILETPDFKSKLFITSSTISPMQIIPSLSKSIRAWSHINLWIFNDFVKWNYKK